MAKSKIDTLAAPTITLRMLVRLQPDNSYDLVGTGVKGKSISDNDLRESLDNYTDSTGGNTDEFFIDVVIPTYTKPRASSARYVFEVN